jgi:DNA-binding transcriptional LysR family regulator
MSTAFSVRSATLEVQRWFLTAIGQLSFTVLRNRVPSAVVLEIRRLRLLYELSHRGTLSAVADALHFSPSAVSQQLAQLEAESGVRLLEHVGRGVRLTDAGRHLAAQTELLLTQLEQAEADLAASDGTPTGTVRIASFQTATLALIPRALRTLQQHERLRVEIAQVEPEQALPALIAHDYDLVIGEEYPGLPAAISAGVHREELSKDRLRLAVPAGKYTRGNAQFRLSQLSQHPWVMEPQGSASRMWATAMCRTAGYEPDVRYESTDLLAHVTLVAHGHAAAFVPDLVWYDRPPSVPVYPLPNQQRLLYTLVRQGSAHHPALRTVREAL